jgi:hypothetical protein
MASNDDDGNKKRKAINDKNKESEYLIKKGEKRGVFLPPSVQLLGTTAFVHSAAYARTRLVMEKLVEELLKIRDPRRWLTRLESPYTLRVALNVLSARTEDKHHQWMQERSLTHSTTIRPEMELSRSWMIQLRDREMNEWITLYEVRNSTLENSGYGLFAARPYKAQDTLGVFYGDITEKNKKEETTDKNYAMQVEWPQKSGNYLLVDPKGGPTTKERGHHPAYFGMHMANDPKWNDKRDKAKRTTRQSPRVNMMVDHRLVCVATRDIDVGDEMFLDYEGDAFDV